MRIRSWSTLVFTLLAFGQLSCAAGGYMTPLEESMPAARAGLRPEYRIFYDALQDYGDWTLIEPFGYVFRPWQNDVGWRPYQDGFWAPSDIYGWVWVSAEPFGWATYHYGEWIYDRYQGWVWIPGLDWGPAWVSWEWTPDYIGWAPMFPPGYSTGLVPGGEYVYVPTSALPVSDLKSRLRTKDQIGNALGAPHAIERLLEHDGVTFNGGPAFELIEKLTGQLPRVKIEDLLAGDAVRTKTGTGTAPARPPERRPEMQRSPATPVSRTAPAPDLDALRKAGEDAARETRRVADSKQAPPLSIGLVRPMVKPEAKHEGRAREEVLREKAREVFRVKSAPDSSKKK